ncbi:hypothetical protein DFQ29_009804 [Apophysomyces sp. BC1021]|nr:hypothetical protein DFQ29_009804 [Apophysomyces sp. BC1021]
MEVDANAVTPTEYMDEDPVNISQPEQDEMYSVAVLIDELKHEDVQLRLNAFKKLPIIAEALGHERTRNELVPFLQESIDDEDEVLLTLAEQLGKLTNAVGGPEYAYYLLAPLENIAAVEEATVREKAVVSLCDLSEQMPSNHLEEYFVPLLKRLSMGEWFTSRTSATGLYAAIYKKSSTALQADLKSMFTQLVQDDSPMVRRAAAKALVRFAGQVAPEDTFGTIVPSFYTLAQDNQDSVRLLTVEDLVALAELLTTEQAKEHLLPSFKALSDDKSWRVRYMVASKYVEISQAFGETIVREHFTNAFIHLLRDPEGEVRTAAAGQIPGYAKLVDKSVILESLLPCVKDLVVDENQHARAALAKEISGLAPIVGQEA